MLNRETYLILQYFVSAVANWWWLILPFLFWKYLLHFYKWWRVENWLLKQKSIVLEIKLPRDILKPVRAMEQVISSIHGATYHPPDWWEEWVDGQVQMSIAFEIASIGGETHFYIRMASAYREAVEASIYSQYPEVEIIEVDDYTKYVPQNIPNKEWDLWGADYRPLKDDHIPIKTYLQFETEQEKDEEKKVDPVSMLLESMAKVKPGCQLWIQISVEPVSEGPLMKWLKPGEELRDKMARRPEAKSATKPMIQEAAQILATGKVEEEEVSEERDIMPPEMKLTPGEREVLGALERKMSKPIFRTNIRFIWMGKRDVWFKPDFRLAFSYFNAYASLNLNILQPTGATLTKIHKSWFLPLNSIRPRRHYLRCRKLFRNYIRRFTPYFPRNQKLTFMLNTEELASLFHFPGKGAAPAPGLSRVEAKRGGGVPNLPSE